MLCICDWATPRLLANDRSRLKLLSSIFSVVAILLPSIAAASTIDWDVASGNYNVNTNWYDYTAAAAPASPPGAADTAHVRNNGTVTLSDSQSPLSLLIGQARFVELDPIGNPGV